MNKLSFAFRILCLITTIALIVFCLYVYCLNEDVCLVDFKNYYDTPDDIHPTISMCFKNFLDSERLMEHGVNDSSYLEYLKGEKISSKLSNIDFENVTLHLKDYVHEYCTHWHNGKFECNGHNLHKTKVVSNSFNGLWRKDFYKCFNLEMPLDGEIELFEVLFDNKVFPQGIRKNKDFVVVFHFPNQLFYSIQTITYHWPARKNKKTYFMTFQVNAMKVLKRRNKKNSPCMANWKTYDDDILKEHTSYVGCRTPYQMNRYNLPVCSTTASIKEADVSLSLQTKKKLLPPCKAMEKIHYSYEEVEWEGSNWEGEGKFAVSLYFLDPRYEEITQSRY